MGKAENRAASQRYAEYMREHHIVRDTGNCPVCHRLVSNGKLLHHFATGCYPRRRVSGSVKAGRRR